MTHNSRMNKDFEEFLVQSGLVQKNRIKYYVRWVNKFLYYCKFRADNPINLNIYSYINHLEQDEKIADW